MHVNGQGAQSIGKIVCELLRQTLHGMAESGDTFRREFADGHVGALFFKLRNEWRGRRKGAETAKCYILLQKLKGKIDK
jgi:hypothetical protein